MGKGKKAFQYLNQIDSPKMSRRLEKELDHLADSFISKLSVSILASKLAEIDPQKTREEWFIWAMEESIEKFGQAIKESESEGNSQALERLLADLPQPPET